jgi:hypothetical protein
MGKKHRKKKKKTAFKSPTFSNEPISAHPKKRKAGFWTITTGIIAIVSLITYRNDIKKLFQSPKEKFEEEKTVQGDLIASDSKSKGYKILEIPPIFSTEAMKNHSYPPVKGIIVPDLKPGGQVYLLVGRMMYIISAEYFYKGIAIVNPFNNCGYIKLELAAREDRLFISTEFRDLEKEEIMGIIEFNRWKLFKENILTFNNDDDRLEVRDKQNRIAFSIKFGETFRQIVVINGYLIGDSSAMVMRADPGDPPDTIVCFQKADSNWRNKVKAEANLIKSIF